MRSREFFGSCCGSPGSLYCSQRFYHRMELWIGHFRMKIQRVPRGGILVHFLCLKLVFPKILLLPVL